MTLCVAALAKVPNTSFAKTNVVVFATDRQSEGETAKAEIGKKVGQAGHEHHILMIAGTHSRAIDLANIISGHLSEPSVIGQGFQHLLEAAVRVQKAHLADEYISGTLGMSYQEFINIGKEKLPDDLYREMISSIARQTLDCTLLVVPFAQMNPMIYRIHESGMVENCEHFAAIGSGYYIAESTLFQREQNEDETIGRTIYNVFEAMKLGAYAPGVSKKFEMWYAEWEYDADDLEEGEEITDCGMVIKSDITPEYHALLEKMYRKYGPRNVGKVDFYPQLAKKEQLAIVVTPVGEKRIREEEARKAAMPSESQKEVKEP